MLERLKSGNYIYYHPLLNTELEHAELEKRKNSNSDRSNEYKEKNKLRMRKERFIKLALNNDFKYFITLTYDPKGKYNNDSFLRSVKRHFLEYYKGCKYILVPELHTKKRAGDIHIHALVNKIPYDTYKIDNHIKTDYFKWGHYDIQTIDQENYTSLIFYLSKYLSKDMTLKNVYSKGLSDTYQDGELINFDTKLFVDIVSRNGKAYSRFITPEKNIKKINNTV